MANKNQTPAQPAAQPAPEGTLTSDWGGEFNVDQFGEDTEQSLRIPHCQIISPPNVDAEMIEQMKKPYGLFLPLEQAEEAGFTPDCNWSLVKHKFKGSAEPTPGYITLRPRFATIRRSRLEIHEKGDNGLYRPVGLAYSRGNEHPLVAETRRPGSRHKLTTRMLMLILGQDNQPLHIKPLLLSARGGSGGALGTELDLFYADLSKAYFDLARSQGKRPKGDRLTDAATAFGVIQFQLGYFIDESSSEVKAPYVVPTARTLPTAQPTTERLDKRKLRQIQLIPAPLAQCLLSKDSPAGILISEWYEAYGGFEALRTSEEEPMTETNMSFNTTDEEEVAELETE